MIIRAEYIWLDGSSPTSQLRCKTRILNVDPNLPIKHEDLPLWGFDGSSTNQAPGHDSDLVLKPVNFITDPIRGEPNILVLCEVFDNHGKPHQTNTRALLREEMKNGSDSQDIYIGIEQEYTLFQDGRPFEWPENGYPGPQGPYYCAVGTGRVFGRNLIEAHTDACIDAGIMIFGTNAEVMPSQWEFQVGYRGIDQENSDPLNVSDHLWFARWLLHRIAEDFEIEVRLDAKPIKGDWNGAGAHTNFSTKAMRDPKTGWQKISDFIKALSKTHDRHIANYGAGLADRLTGHHETCDMKTFKAGERDRGASIRIPEAVAKNKYGYIEDRRPGASCDPYLVCTELLKTYNSL